MSINTENTGSSENFGLGFTSAELFFENNKKVITMVGGGILAIVVLFFGYTKLIVAPKEKEAQSQIFVAEKYFTQDSFNLALKGDGNYMGFVDIADEYSVTKTGKLACYYAGISYLRLGEFQNAIDYLKKFNAGDKMIQPIAYGSMGDAFLELNEDDQAIKYYKKAANYSKNDYTRPLYLFKLAMVYDKTSDAASALEAYKKIKYEYPFSMQSRYAEKYIARAEAKN